MHSCPWTHLFECLDSYRSHYFGVSLKIQCPSLCFPPFLPPSLRTTPPPAKSWHPESTLFSQSPEPAVVPWQKRPSAGPWASVSRPPYLSLLVFFPNRAHFLLPLKLGCIQKFLTSLKRERWKIMQKNSQKLQSARAEKQRQTQVRTQRAQGSRPARPIPKRLSTSRCPVSVSVQCWWLGVHADGHRGCFVVWGLDLFPR